MSGEPDIASRSRINQAQTHLGLHPTVNLLGFSSSVHQEITLPAPNTAEQATVARLIALVLDSVTSEHSRRSYRAGLVRFFGWIQMSGSRPTFTKALVGEYRAVLLASGLSAATVNLRLASVRRLAREMADNGLLDLAVATATARVTGVARHGTRLGNWLNKEQANDLLNAPNPKTLAGKRDRAILALLIGCGLRRAELLRLNLEDLQQREARWVLPDLLGKGNRVRTVTVPAGSRLALMDGQPQPASPKAGSSGPSPKPA